MNQDRTEGGPASKERLQALLSALIDALQSRLACPEPLDVEFMNCVRLLLRDNGIEAGPEQISALKEMHTRLALHLADALSRTAAPPATALETSRRFLRDNGVTKDTETSAEIREGLKALTDISIPFQ